MDRLDALRAFVLVVDLGSLSAAARSLQRSPAAITRAIASIETRLGAEMLRRTTRSLRLTEVGERYLAVARRVLAELDDAEKNESAEKTMPHGLLTVTAPLAFGAMHVRPLIEAYLAAYGEVRARLFLLDRVVNVVDEGVDVAVRVGELPDSALVAVGVGEVQRVVVASPAYLEQRGVPRVPTDLAGHRCISCSAVTPGETWAFGAGGGDRGKTCEGSTDPHRQRRGGRGRRRGRRSGRHVRALLPGGGAAANRRARATHGRLRSSAGPGAAGLSREQHPFGQGPGVRRPCRAAAPERTREDRAISRAHAAEVSGAGEAPVSARSEPSGNSR